MKCICFHTAIFCFLLIFIFSGCFTSRVLNLPRAWDDLEKDKLVKFSDTSPKGEINITIACPSCFGCYLKKFEDEEGNRGYFCKGVSVDKKSANKTLEKLAEKDKDALKSGVLFDKFCSILEKAMNDNLKRYYNNVSVSIGNSGIVTPSIDYIMHGVSIFGGQEAKISLVATASDGTTTQATGTARDSISAAMLGWGIPVAVLTFPIGVGIVGLSIQGGFTGIMEQVTVDAIYKASAKLAEQIAAKSDISGITEWTIQYKVVEALE